jgi:hypothetical protein
VGLAAGCDIEALSSGSGDDLASGRPPDVAMGEDLGAAGDAAVGADLAKGVRPDAAMGADLTMGGKPDIAMGLPDIAVGLPDIAVGFDLTIPCGDGGCGLGFMCCNGACINPNNDILNCGGCGVMCMGTHPYCDGKCEAQPPCTGGVGCQGGLFCCGSACCQANQICCQVQGGAFFGPRCYDPTMSGGTCPLGCPMCP